MVQQDVLGIRWKLHLQSVHSMVVELTSEDYSDVTLVSDGLQVYKVHKIVLSAISPVFKELLVGNPHEHPLIYLNGVKDQELQYF